MLILDKKYKTWFKRANFNFHDFMKFCVVEPYCVLEGFLKIKTKN